MRVLVGTTWRDGYLDEHRAPGHVRIAPALDLALPPITDLYFVARRDWGRVRDYVRHLGPRRVLRKIRSRLAESGRNEKHVRVGVGRVLEADEGAAFAPGDPVLYVAPCHPRCSERVVVPAVLVRKASAALAARIRDGALRHADLADAPAALGGEVAGYSSHSGVEPGAWAGAALDAAAQVLLGFDDASLRETTAAVSTPCERRAATAPSGSRRAALVGLGHYAKTNVLPNLDPRLRVHAVHEIDPLQIGVPPDDGRAYDTAPLPPDSPDVVFVAGYHHTHADIATRVLRDGGVAVVEKPLATTRAQLAALLEAMGDGPSRLFPCFQKRWSPANAWAREDLAAPAGSPVHYHAIVYEVPLPARHWYRWPNSRSRIVCNGCHWIDHFMFFNGYVPALRHAAWESIRGDVVCTAELANGASFSLVITDHGSGRLGVRDHVELRAGEVTVRVTDGVRYDSESTRGRIRSRRVGRFDPYAAMYKDISTAVLEGRPGDPAAHVAAATGLMLDLEDARLESRKRFEGFGPEGGG